MPPLKSFKGAGALSSTREAACASGLARHENMQAKQGVAHAEGSKSRMRTPSRRLPLTMASS